MSVPENIANTKNGTEHMKQDKWSSATFDGASSGRFLAPSDATPTRLIFVSESGVPVLAPSGRRDARPTPAGASEGRRAGQSQTKLEPLRTNRKYLTLPILKRCQLVMSFTTSVIIAMF